jgi:hypothetical protein
MFGVFNGIKQILSRGATINKNEIQTTANARKKPIIGKNEKPLIKSRIATETKNIPIMISIPLAA